MTATFGAMTGCHRTSRSATELGIRALSHPDCIPGTFEAVGLRQPVLVVFNKSNQKWFQRYLTDPAIGFQLDYSDYSKQQQSAAAAPNPDSASVCTLYNSCTFELHFPRRLASFCTPTAQLTALLVLLE